MIPPGEDSTTNCAPWLSPRPWPKIPPSGDSERSGLRTEGHTRRLIPLRSPAQHSYPSQELTASIGALVVSLLVYARR